MADSPTTGFLTLQEIVENYVPPMPEATWDDVFNSFTNPAAVEEINILKEELIHDGQFKEPVILYMGETDVDEETGEEKIYPKSVSNGCHRLTSHFMTGIDPVFVQFGENVFNDENPYVTVNLGIVYDDSDDDFDWEVFSSLRCEVLNQGWMCPESGFRSEGIHEITLETNSDFDPAVVSAVDVYEFFVTRMNRVFGDKVSVLWCNFSTWDDDTEEPLFFDSSDWDIHEQYYLLNEPY